MLEVVLALRVSPGPAQMFGPPSWPHRVVDWGWMRDYSGGASLLGVRRPRGESKPPKCLMNLPNSLTILRIFFVPLLVVVLLTREPNLVVRGVLVRFEIWGVLILLVAAATDWADGYLDRKSVV